MFSEESLGKIKVKHVKLLRNGAVHEFYRLKGTSEYLVSVIERGKLLVNKTLIVGITGLVLYTRMSLVMGMQFILGDLFITLFLFGNDAITLE